MIVMATAGVEVGFLEFSMSASRDVSQFLEIAPARHTQKSNFWTFENLPADTVLGPYSQEFFLHYLLQDHLQDDPNDPPNDF